MIQLSELKIDALLVSALPNIRYLSGFTGSNGLLLITPDSQTLFTDPRYTIQASQESKAKVKIVAKGPLEAAAVELIRRKKLKRIGFESTRMIYESYRRLKEALPLGAGLKPIGAVIEKLRMIKSPEEIARIRQSVLTNSEAFESTVRSIRPGVSEMAIAAELDFKMRRLGAEKAAFETIVATGTRTALPHAQPSQQKAAVNELLLIDMGSCQNGYMSDMTRMLFLGRPDRKVTHMYKAVLKAQLAAIDGVRAGITAGQVDRKARQVLESEGLGKEFVHSTGHGLGLEIHELPRIGRKDPTRLEAGMVITIEPGAYIRDFGGVRIEDTVLVTKNGCEVLTATSKELMLL
ncbi:MAG TPA: Xaa-Pro peptidase family protein [Bryobacteraceae bacterium]|nr:Xaa-Pro peptidase family protein [Bryobacteraceae bacterium]